MSRLASALRLALILALAWGLGSSTAVQGREPAPNVAMATVELAALPPEARQTLNLIQRGGPFPYPHKDGSTFGNFEKRLPIRQRGYYREYTVPTPGSHDRGARRIVAGGGPPSDPDLDPERSGEYFYTDDHYRLFRRIRQP